METPPEAAQPNQPEETKAPKKQRGASVTVPAKDFVNDAWDEHQRGLQTRISGFLLRAYGFLLAATMLIFYLQGFRPWGFNLSETTLNWIGAATIGQVAGLLTLTIKSVFGKGRN